MSFNLTGGNPRAHRIRVYYEGSSTLYEGMPVCYNYDTTTNWHGGSMTLGAVTASTTTAEGGRNEGKYIRVEDPATANLGYFAGVVAKGSPGIGTTTGTCAIDIYVPNGAIVPVRTDASTTVGVTVLGIANGSTLCASGGRPVAIALETEDLSSDNGVVLAVLDPSVFGLYQGGVGAGQTWNGLTGGIANYLYNSFAATSGTACGFFNRVKHTGTCATTFNSYGLLNYLELGGAYTNSGYERGILQQVVVSGTINGAMQITGAHIQLGESGSGTCTNYEHLSCLWLETGGGLKASGNTLANEYEFIKLSNGSHAEEGPGQCFFIYGGNGIAELFDFDTCLNGGGATDHFIYPHGTGALAYVKNTTGAILKIKCDVDGTAYYLMLYSDPVEAT